LNFLHLLFKRWCLPKLWLLLPGMILVCSTGQAQSSHSDLAYASFPQALNLQTASLANASNSGTDINTLIKKGIAFKTTLCLTKNNRPVETYYFPGTSTKRAMIIGGVHGSELSSIELAYHVIDQLNKGFTPYFNVLIVPSLFPDNAVCALRDPDKIYQLAGRYTSDESPDPNRQMPALGKPFEKELPFDFHGREIEKENQFLLSLIQEFKPERIANLHAIRDPFRAGIFADPKTDHNGIALGFHSDSLLAASMNLLVCINGGGVAAPVMDTLTVVYHKDPPVVPAGFLQPRNIQGSKLPGKWYIAWFMGNHRSLFQ
jgi:hypothetical protein